MDLKEAIKFAPPGMKEWLEIVVEDYTFKKFEADSKWNKKSSSYWQINCDIADVNAMEKMWKKASTKKTVGNRKVVDINMKEIGIKWNIRFRESRKTGKVDAKSTKKQEAGSKAVFEYCLANKRGGFSSESAFNKDEKLMAKIREVYEDVDAEWLSVFYKQHKVIISKFARTDITQFDHEGGFMKEITKIVNKNFGISKKDNWNPADLWGVKGSSDAVIKKVQATVSGTRDSQTIQQLNALLRGMYKAGELMGVSLKKTSGAKANWEEYNLEALRLDEVDDYKYKKRDVVMNVSYPKWTQDSKVNLRQSGGGPEYDFQIKANDSSKFSNLKFESTPVGGRSARGGKAEVKAVVALLKDNNVGGDFDNKHQNYPMNFDQFMTGAKDSRKLIDYKKMYTAVASKAETNIRNEEEFATNIGKIFLSDKPWEANSKLMQLHFFYEVGKIQENKKAEFWTDMVFLSIKKGDRFGPFGKLY